MQRPGGAVFDAVHAQVTFAAPPCGVGIASPLAGLQASVAAGAVFDMALDAEYRPSGQDSQQCAQGAKDPAPEAGHEPVGRQDGEKEHRDHQAAMKNGSIGINSQPPCLIQQGESRNRHGTDDQGDGIQYPHLQPTREGDDQEQRQQVIFDPEQWSIGIEPMALGRAGAGGAQTEELVQDPQGADPGAKETPQEQGWNQDDERQDQPVVQGLAGHESTDGNQGIHFQEHGDVVPLHAPEIGDDEQEEEKTEKKSGVKTPDGPQSRDGNVHDVRILSKVTLERQRFSGILGNFQERRFFNDHPSGHQGRFEIGDFRMQDRHHQMDVWRGCRSSDVHHRNYKIISLPLSWLLRVHDGGLYECFNRDGMQ